MSPSLAAHTPHSHQHVHVHPLTLTEPLRCRAGMEPTTSAPLMQPLPAPRLYYLLQCLLLVGGQWWQPQLGGGAALSILHDERRASLSKAAAGQQRKHRCLCSTTQGGTNICPPCVTNICSKGLTDATESDFGCGSTGTRVRAQDLWLQFSALKASVVMLRQHCLCVFGTGSVCC